MTENQEMQYIISIAEKLCDNAGKIRYGSVSVILKVNNGRVVEVTHSVTKNTREPEKQK